MQLPDDRAALFREHPPEWWGWPWRLPRPLTVTELIAARSLDAPLAALLWLALERRASMLVAAGPNGAGKTVTLSALLEFLPPDIRRVHLRGMAEDFAFVADAEPAHTYLLVNEISDHLPSYLWGRGARRAFELLDDGFGLAGTLHAEGIEDTVEFLRAPPLAVPDHLLARIPLVVTLLMLRRGGAVVRRVAGVHLAELASGSLRYQPLAVWDAARDVHEHDPAPLAARLELTPAALRAAVSARARALDDLVARAPDDVAGLRATVAAFREGAPP